MCIHASTNDLRDRLSNETENAGTVETPMRVCNWYLLSAQSWGCSNVSISSSCRLCALGPQVHAKDREYLLIRS